jgi:hypothetical protein
MTRFLGTPRVSMALCVVSIVVVAGWVGHAVPWWIGLIALYCVTSVRKAVKDMRHYNQWWASWHGMGSMPSITPKPAVRRRKASSPWTGVIAAALLLVIIPMAAAGADEGLLNFLALLWLGVAAYLVCRVAANLRRARASVTVKAAPASPAAATKANTAGVVDVVQWVLPPASSSPSRSDAMRELPDYCARLMAGAEGGL